jgi:hypothetical protein
MNTNENDPLFGEVIYTYTRAHAIRQSQPGKTRLPFALYVRNDNRRPRLIKLIAICGALDYDDPTPAITIAMPDDD